MKLKTTSNRTKIQLKGRIWLPSVIAAMYFLIFPVWGFLLMESQKHIEPAGLLIRYEQLWESQYLIMGMIVAMLAGIISALEGYAYLYSYKKTVFYHSLPIKRSTMFWKKTGYAIVSFEAPYLFMGLLAFLPGMVEGVYSLKIRYLALEMCLLHFLVYMLFYFLTEFVVLMTGNYLMGILSFVGINLFFPLAGWILQIIKAEFFTTYYNVSTGLENYLIEWCSPFTAAVNFCMDGCKKIPAVMGVVMVFMLMCMAAYLKRPIEKTGKSLIYEWSHVLITFLANLLGGAILGMLFYNISQRFIWGMVGIFLGVILSHCIVQIIINMNFQKVFSKSIVGGLSLLVILISGCALCCDWAGFDSYLPEYEEIESIHVYGTLGIFSPVVEENKDGSIKKVSLYSEDYLEYCNMGKDKTLYAFLENLVENQKTYDETDAKHYFVMYKLNSGKKVYRQYIGKNCEKEFIDCIKEKDAFDLITVGFLDRIDIKYLEDIECYASGTEPSLVVRNQENMKKYSEALYQDISHSTGETYEAAPIGVIRFCYLITGENQQERVMFHYVDIYPDYERVVEIIETESPEFFNTKYEGLG